MAWALCFFCPFGCSRSCLFYGEKDGGILFCLLALRLVSPVPSRHARYRTEPAPGADQSGALFGGLLGPLSRTPGHPAVPHPVPLQFGVVQNNQLPAQLVSRCIQQLTPAAKNSAKQGRPKASRVAYSQPKFRASCRADPAERGCGDARDGSCVQHG